MASNETSSFRETLQFPSAPSPLSILSEDSFVVLKTNEHNQVIEVVMDTDDAIPQVSLSSELPSCEMHDKMLQILEENTLLRARIFEINKVMSLQHENIIAWKEHQLQAKDDKELFEMLKKQNSTLADELEKIKYKNELLENEVTILTHNLTKLKQLYKINERDLEASKKEIEELLKINSNFKEEFKQFKINKDQEGILLKQFQKENEELSKQNLSLVKELVRMKIKQTDQDEEVLALKQNLNILSRTHDNNLKNLGLAEKEIVELKTQLNEARSRSEQQSKSLNNDIVAMKSQLQLLSTKPSDEMVKIKEQLNTAKFVLVHLEQSKVIADGQIEALSNETKDLRTKLQESQQQTHELHALKVQLDVFKEDFEAEKDMKRIIKDENEKLSEEIQTLRTNCQRLEEEVSALRSLQVVSHDPEISTVFATSSNCSTVQSLMCPICNFEFIVEQDLLNHVERCINM